MPPTKTGEPGHNERDYYVRSTLCVTVGDEWLAVEWDYSSALAQRLGLLPDTPIGIIADYAEERTLPVDVMLLRACKQLCDQCEPHGIDPCQKFLVRGKVHAEL
jgi:hypothetical protein